MTRSRKTGGFRRTPLAQAVIAVVAMTMTIPALAKPAYQDWFRYDEKVTRTWKITGVPGDPYRVKIERRKFRASDRQRRIFVLYPRPSSAYDVAITKILEVFAEKGIDAEFTVVNFNRDHNRAKAALKQADEGRYELIFSMGSESTAWLYKNYRGGRKPVVSVTSKDPVVLRQIADYNTGSGNNFAFTSLNMPIDVQMDYVKKLKPKLKNIGVLVNSKNVSAVQTQAQPLARYARLRGIRVLNLAIQNPANAREELAELVAKAVATMRKNDPTLDNSIFWITGSTAVFKEIATINAHADRVPVLSVVTDVVKAGNDSAVLSVGIGFESNAHLAAIYGAEVLSGRVRVGDLKVGVVTPPDFAINFRKAREIGLRIPYSFFERSSFIYDYDGIRVRNKGRSTVKTN